MIILEGMDGSGKSTLAKQIGLPVIHPGAPPKTKELEAQFFFTQCQDAHRPVVYDRVTCVSQQVYRKRMFDPWYMNPLNQLISTPHCVIVYCRPPDEIVLDLSKHTVSDHDTPEMLQLVRDNAALFLKSYDELMATIPHVKYDYTTMDLQSFLIELAPTQYIYKEWQECMKQQKPTPKLS